MTTLGFAVIVALQLATVAAAVRLLVATRTLDRSFDDLAAGVADVHATLDNTLTTLDRATARFDRPGSGGTVSGG